MDNPFKGESEREYQDRTKKIEGLPDHEASQMPPRRPDNRMINDNKQGSPDGKSK